jgi:hypothetical protein
MDLAIDSLHADPDWKPLVERISRLGTGSRDVFGPEHRVIGGYYLQQNVYELAALIMALRRVKAASHQELRYLEIGSASGGTAKVLHDEVGFSHMVSIDLPSQLAEIKRERFKEFPIVWTEVDSMSYEALRWLVDSHVAPFDVVFIDGDHHRTGDIMMDRAFCRPESVMVFHDAIAVSESVGVRVALDLAYDIGVLRKLAHYSAGGPELGIELAEVR